MAALSDKISSHPGSVWTGKRYQPYFVDGEMELREGGGLNPAASSAHWEDTEQSAPSKPMG